MEKGMIISLVAIVIMVIIIIVLAKKILSMCRDLRNYFRTAFGKNTAEQDKADRILLTNTKNGMIPGWAGVDALKTLMKYYEPEEAGNYIASYLQLNQVHTVEIPRHFKMAPGSTPEQLTTVCNSHFDKFNFKGMAKEDGMTKKDYDVFTNLINMWYFADNSIQTTEEARNAVTKAWGLYCESHPEKTKLL